MTNGATRPHWLKGAGDLAARIGALDWAPTPLGELSEWPQSLRTVVNILLGSPCAMSMGWGEQLTFIYNDAFRPVLGTRDPSALASPGRTVWSDIAADMGPRIDAVLASGVAAQYENVLLVAERGGVPEDTYYNISCRPLDDDSGSPAGLLWELTETTDEWVARRRTAILRRLTAELTNTNTKEQVLAAAGRQIGAASADLPYVMIYLFEGGDYRRASLACAIGIERGSPAAPEILETEEPDDAVAHELLAHALPPAAQFAIAGGQAAGHTITLPIRSPGQRHPVGFLLAALRPGGRVDERYAAFLDVVVSQIATALDRVRDGRAEPQVLIERIAELTPAVINVFDLDSQRNIYITGDINALLGYTNQDYAVLEPSRALLHPDDIPPYEENLARLSNARDGEILTTQYRMRHRNGEWRWLASRVAPFLRSGNGAVRLVVGATIDITERKWAEDALRASEERFRSYFELGLIGMAITSPEKGVLEVNDEICRILGYDREELLKKTWAEMTHPDDVAADVIQFERVMSGEAEGYSMDKRWIRKDGQVIDSTISVKCARRQDGAVDYFVALLQDISARKRAEKALAASQLALERRVARRTSELTAVNEELQREIAERREAESESLNLREQLAADLQAMTQLHDFSTRLIVNKTLTLILEEALDAIIALQEADFGDAQLYNSQKHSLELVAQRGFEQDYVDYFRHVSDGSTPCGRAALLERTRVIVEDVRTDPAFAPYHAAAARAGVVGVQSTPLFGRRGQLLGVMSTHFRQPHRPSERELRLTDLYAAYAAEMFERSQTEAATLRYQQELQALTAKLIAAQEASAKYLARELHDDFSQRLAVLGMDLAACAREASSERAAAQILALADQLGELTKDIHRISHRLHPAILDDLGLAAAIRNEGAAFAGQHGVNVDLRLRNVPAEIPDDVSLCLYRVTQECLHNIGKHSGSTEVRVRLTGNADKIVLVIADSGDGFDLEDGRGKGGLGLISMEERVRMVNGSFRIRSKPDGGTVVRISVPLRHP